MTTVVEETTVEDKNVAGPVGPKRLKKIDACNDYVIIWLSAFEVDGVELPEETKAKLKNEGVVIGLGPDVNKGPAHNYQGTEHEIILGDRVVIRSNKYNMINPQHGPYAGQDIVLVHKLDLVYRHSKHNPEKYQFSDSWDAADTNEAAKANLA